MERWRPIVRILLHLHGKFPCMDRLLAVLFSVMLLIATAPPKAPGGDCSFSGGICTAKQTGSPAASGGACSLDHESDNGNKPACPTPICCVCGPCCCLCLVPERPVLPVAYWSDEVRTKPATHRDFLPQQVGLSVWKPPAFSV